MAYPGLSPCYTTFPPLTWHLFSGGKWWNINQSTMVFSLALLHLPSAGCMPCEPRRHRLERSHREGDASKTGRYTDTITVSLVLWWLVDYIYIPYTQINSNERKCEFLHYHWKTLKWIMKIKCISYTSIGCIGIQYWTMYVFMSKKRFCDMM